MGAGDWSSAPDKLRLPHLGWGGKREKDTEEVERNGNLFNFCQSRREEDNSQTGMMSWESEDAIERLGQWEMDGK